MSEALGEPIETVAEVVKDLEYALACCEEHGLHIGELKRAIPKVAALSTRADAQDGALAALKELVACKDLHDTLDKYKATRGVRPADYAGIQLAYEKRKGPAWAAARAAIDAARQSGGGE